MVSVPTCISPHILTHFYITLHCVVFVPSYISPHIPTHLYFTLHCVVSVPTCILPHIHCIHPPLHYTSFCGVRSNLQFPAYTRPPLHYTSSCGVRSNINFTAYTHPPLLYTSCVVYFTTYISAHIPVHLYFTLHRVVSVPIYISPHQ